MPRFSRSDAACLRRPARAARNQLAERFCDVVLLLGALALIVLAGCVTPTKEPAAAPASTADHSAGPPAVESQPMVADGPADDRLAAVEDFLSRTQKYRTGRETEKATDHAVPSSAGTLPMKVTRRSSSDSDIEGSRTPPTDLPAKEPVVSANSQMDAIPQPAAPKPALPAVERVGVRAGPPSDAEIPLAPSNVANVAMLAAGDVETGFDKLIAHLRKEAAEARSFDSEWRLRLAYLALDRPSEAREMPQSLTAEEKELLSEVVEAAVIVRELARHPTNNADEAVDRLESFQTTLAKRADPVVSGLAFCSKVTTFGVYDEMKETDFVAGRSVPTILYSELRNFRSQLNAAGLYETRLKTRVEVLSASGTSVWSREEPEIVDQCRNRRRDFFIAQRLTLPPTLPAGDYVLKAYVEDVLASRATEATKRFSTVAPLSVAKSDDR